MALKTTFTDANKVTNSLLSIRYTVANDSKADDETYSADFVTTRTATKSYSYVGMTRAAAESCKAAKTAQYTREYCRLCIPVASTYRSVIYDTLCGANIQVKHDHDDSWRCDIEVNETDLVPGVSNNPALLFSDVVNTRQYDETMPDLVIRITDISYNSSEQRTYLTIWFDPNYFESGFSVSDMTLYTSSNPFDIAWTQISFNVESPTVISRSGGGSGEWYCVKGGPFTSRAKKEGAD